jgi:ABC-2 type transport system ATP-binding protein
MTSILMQVHREIFVLTTREPVVALPLFDEFDVRLVNEHELQVEITRNQDLNGLFQVLGTAGIKVISMRNKSNRLEEVFLRLTERSGEEGSQPLAARAS